MASGRWGRGGRTAAPLTRSVPDSLGDGRLRSGQPASCRGGRRGRGRAALPPPRTHGPAECRRRPPPTALSIQTYCAQCAYVTGRTPYGGRPYVTCRPAARQWLCRGRRGGGRRAAARRAVCRRGRDDAAPAGPGSSGGRRGDTCSCSRRHRRISECRHIGPAETSAGPHPAGGGGRPGSPRLRAARPAAVPGLGDPTRASSDCSSATAVSTRLSAHTATLVCRYEQLCKNYGLAHLWHMSAATPHSLI